MFFIMYHLVPGPESFETMSSEWFKINIIEVCRNQPSVTLWSSQQLFLHLFVVTKPIEDFFFMCSLMPNT
jgi:hypothetical protein